MFRYLKLIILVLLVLAIYRFGPEIGDTNYFQNQKDEPVSEPRVGEFVIMFYKIDNRVKVHMRDTIIFDSGWYDYNNDVTVEFDYKKFLNVGENTLSVELINAGQKNPWEVNYEIYYDGELFDYWREKSKVKHAEGGSVFMRSTTIDHE